MTRENVGVGMLLMTLEIELHLAERLRMKVLVMGKNTLAKICLRKNMMIL